MLKTTLKIATLSAVSLTLLSACGASDAINNLANTLAAERKANNIGTIGRSSIRYASDDGFYLTVRSMEDVELPEQAFGSAITITDVPVLNVPEGTVISKPTISSRTEGSASFIANGDSTDPESYFEADVFDVTTIGTDDQFNLRAGDAPDTFVMTAGGIDYIVSYEENSSTLESEDGVLLNISDGFNVNARANGNDDSYSDILNDVLTGTPVGDAYGGDIYGAYVYYGIDISGFSIDDTVAYKKGDRREINDYKFSSGFATIGVLTTPAQIQAQNATATYQGRLELEYALARANNNDIDDLDTVHQSYGAQTRFDVDFNANTISGGATFSRYVVATQESINIGNATFGVANINSNSFVGNFILDRGARALFFLTDNPVGQYAGNFFGPSAENLAGVVSINGTTPNGLTIGAGGFDANKVTDPTVHPRSVSTLPEQLTAQTATATYTGPMGGGLYPTGAGAIDSIPAFYEGSLAMTVDFDANTIEGEGTFSNVDADTNNVITQGIATFAQTTFSSDGDYKGDLSFNSKTRTYLGITDNQTGTYTGGFFGTSGEFLAGELVLRGENSNGSVVFAGVFHVDKQ